MICRVYKSPIIVTVVTSRKLEWTGHVIQMKIRETYTEHW